MPLIPEYLKPLYQDSRTINYGLKNDKIPCFNDDKFLYTRNGDRLVHPFNTNSYRDILDYTLQKQNNIKESLESAGYLVKTIDIKQTWRLVLNLGEKNAYENGFLLHPVYGVPYLSESAIKGMVRTYVIENYYDFDEDSALKCPDFQILFGEESFKSDELTKGNIGLIHFHPAFLTERNFEITADVITNLNENYYNKDNDCLLYTSDAADD